MSKYFVSFIEEAVMNPECYGYIGGRIEIYGPKDHYAREEIRWFTNKREAFYDFREEYDFDRHSALVLHGIIGLVRCYFNDSPSRFMRKVNRICWWLDTHSPYWCGYVFYKLLQRR